MSICMQITGCRGLFHDLYHAGWRDFLQVMIVFANRIRRAQVNLVDDFAPWCGLFQLEGEAQQQGFFAMIGRELHADWQA